MAMSLDLASIILIITVIQGISLGCVLVFGRTLQHPSTYLGLALIAFSLGLVYDVFRHVNIFETYPNLCYLPIKLYYLPAPFTYLFARKLTPEPLTSKDYAWLVPSGIEFLMLTILFFLPIGLKSNLELQDSEWKFAFTLYRHLWIPFSILLLAMCYQLISQNRNQFMNFFSGSQDKLMSWAMRWSIFAGIICTSFLTKFLVDQQVYDTFFFPVMASLIFILIFCIGTWGIKESFIDFDYHDISQKKSRKSTKLQEISSKENEQSGQIILQSLKAYIEENKPYRDSNLNLKSLSKACGISSRQISSTINKHAGVNFNTFINEFRVEEAKRMLVDETYSHLNILGIGLEVGFNSKATFYAVFKKQTEMTPSSWQKGIK